MHEEKPTGKLDPKQESSLDRRIEQAKQSYMPSIVRHEDDGSATEMTLVERSEINSLRHDTEVAEHERDEARKELEEWRRAHSRPICNPPEATGAYVDVLGEMTVAWTVKLPVELCHEPIACDDPAIEAALQAVSGHICTYIWGEDKKPAVVYCDLNEQNVEIESDDRKHLKKHSTRLTDEPVNSESCNDGELGEKCDQS